MKKIIWIISGLVLVGIIGFIVYEEARTRETDSAVQDNQIEQNKVMGQDQNAAESMAVDIANFKYNPSNLTVKVGDKITFKNNDSVMHTVTARNGDFDMPVNPGETVTIVFEKPGTIDYYCKPHPSMTGKVVVN